MSIEDLIKRYLADPEIPNGQKDGIQAILASHIEIGRQLQKSGKLHEAVEEYEKEHDRPIRSHIDADIVQASYWFEGKAYRELGELEKAITAFQKARELFNLHGIGTSSNDELAEIFISLGRFDEAIDLCQEVLERVPAWPTQQLLNKALKLKEKSSSRDNNTG